MLVAFALLIHSASTIPVGAYAMPELCAKLTEATGSPHATDVNLRDYPIFIGVKSGAPERIKKLMEKALHAEWRQDGQTYRLVTTKPANGEGFEEFKKQLDEAVKQSPLFASIPAVDLYQAQQGELIRYSENGKSPYFKKMPEAMKKLVDEQRQDNQRPTDDEVPLLFNIRRAAYGYFETKPGYPSINFLALPPEAKAFVGEAGGKTPLSTQDAEAFAKLSRDPRSANIDFVNVTKQDPMNSIYAPLLVGIQQKVDKDMVIALPDMAILGIAFSNLGAENITKVLGALSIAIVWEVSDDALIGKLPTSELNSPTQAKRSSISSFVESFKKAGVANIDSLSRYVSTQRPASSVCWMDVLMLVFAGVAVDEQWIADYPFNVWLYASFTQTDWIQLRSGQPFTADLLSPIAKSKLTTLLMNTRQIQSQPTQDPALWPSLAYRDLVVTPKLQEETVLVHTNGAGMIDTVSTTAANYSMRKQEARQEPTYLVGKRTKLKLTITLAIPDTFNRLETGFSNIELDANSKPCEWKNLPEPLRKEFEDVLKRGVPPPKYR